MKMKRILKKLDELHDQDRYPEIIELISEIPENKRDYDIISHLARAYNNSDMYQEAISQLLLIKEQGKEDPIWHFRLGYAYFYLSDFKNAEIEFKLAYELDDEDKMAEWFLNFSEIELFMSKISSDEFLN
jgi:tetratricopeptide (TPR) repeat protein